MGEKRALIAVLGAVVFLDAMLFGALAPLIPLFASEFDLSKRGAGLLVAALGAGLLAGGIPAGLVATRIGAKRTLMIGLVLLAAASLAFAVSDGPWALGLSRLGQGVASAMTWVAALAWIAAVAPAERKGGLIGTVFGAAVFGAIVGPLFGAAAAAVGIRTVFEAVSVGVLLLAASALVMDAPRVENRERSALARALRDPRFLGALWLSTLPALLFSLLELLGPLALSRRGFGATSVGLTFFGAGLIEVVINPLLGRYSDRVGRLRPARLALAVSAIAATGLALVSAPAPLVALVAVAGVGFGGLNTPGLALISDRAQSAGLAQTLAFGAMTVTWGVGALVGPGIGGLLADKHGDTVPYLAASSICLLTLLASYAIPHTGQVAAPREPW